MDTKTSFAAVTNLVNALSEDELAALVNNVKQTQRFAGSLINALTEEELIALADNIKQTKEFAGDLVFDKKEVFFVPIADENVPEFHQNTLAKWRKFASDLGYGGLICWKVREGFTFSHAPKAGPCFENFAHLKDWNLQNNEATRSGYVFFIPRLVEDSQSKNVAQQRRLLGMTRCYYDLPSHHLASFGSIALLCGLILGYLRHTKDREVLKARWARTDTFFGDEMSLSLGGAGAGLNCYFCEFDKGLKDLGVFPIGIELDRE